MSMKLKKTLALVLSLVTVFSAAFTSMADVEVVEELDQIVVPEEPVEAVADVYNAAPEVIEVAEVVEGGLAEGGAVADATAGTFFGETPDVSTWGNLQAAINATPGDGTTPASTSTTIQLTDDLTADLEATPSDTALTIPKGKNITLDLNGKTLDRGLTSQGWSSYTERGSGEVIYIVTGAKLIIKDTSSAKTGTITGGSSKRAGGVYVSNDGTFIMEGGTICGNTGNEGGGVYNNGTFEMKNGCITGNKGGVSGVLNDKNFKMTGGMIVNNDAIGMKADNYSNASCCIFNAGNEGSARMWLEAADGKEIQITGNTSGSSFGTICNWATLYLSGKVMVTGNTPMDLVHNNESVETIQVGNLSGSNIGVELKDFTSESVTGVLTSGYSENNPGAGLTDFFHYCGPNYAELKNGEINIKKTDKLSYRVFIDSEIENGIIKSSLDKAVEDEVVTITAIPDEGYELTSLKYHSENELEGEFTYDQFFKMPNSNVTVTATFEEAQTTIAEISLPAGLPGVKYEVKDVTDPQNPVTLSPKASTTAGASAYEVKIGAKIEITAIPAEGYVVTGTNPYVIEKVTKETVVNLEDLPSVQSKQQGSMITFSAGTGVKSAVVYSKMTGGTQTFTSDQLPVTLPIPAGEEIIIKSVECESGYTCDLTLPYTYIVPDHDDTFTITAGRSSDPKPTPVNNDTKEEREPLYTGTWNAPVKSGSWSQDAHGIWHYTSSETFRNTWAYILNPYAHDGQNTSDWFWFDRQGNMLTGWQFINGKWYYLNPTKDGTLGACLIGRAVTPDGWTVDESGAWIESIPKK